jgi:hypothetical protein
LILGVRGMYLFRVSHTLQRASKAIVPHRTIIFGAIKKKGNKPSNYERAQRSQKSIKDRIAFVKKRGQRLKPNEVNRNPSARLLRYDDGFKLGVKAPSI